MSYAADEDAGITELQVREFAKSLAAMAAELLSKPELPQEVRKSLEWAAARFAPEDDDSDVSMEFDAFARFLGKSRDNRFLLTWLFNIGMGAFTIGVMTIRWGDQNGLVNDLMSARQRELASRPRTMKWHERGEALRILVVKDHPGLNEMEIAREIIRRWKPATYPKLPSEKRIVAWLSAKVKRAG